MLNSTFFLLFLFYKCLYTFLITGKKDQLAELEDERKQLLASLRDLNNISVALDSLDLTFDHLVGRLGALHGIWHLVGDSLGSTS